MAATAAVPEEGEVPDPLAADKMVVMVPRELPVATEEMEEMVEASCVSLRMQQLGQV